MKTVLRAMVILGLLIGGCVCATADTITWTLSDIAFDNGNVATGYFVTDSSLIIQSYAITVSGPASGAAFTAAILVQAYLPGTVGFADSTFNMYVDLVLTSNLTSAGGVVPVLLGYDCPGCGTLLLAADGHDPTINGVSVPEPSLILLLGIGVGAVSLICWRFRA